MQLSTLLILSLIIAGFAITIYLLNQRFRQLEEATKEDETTKLMSEWMKQIVDQTRQTRQETQDRLDTSGKAINERLDNAAKIIGKLSHELGQMSEIGRSMRDLQDFLKSPKLRGNIGEQILRDLLEQMVPKENFSLQYSFGGGAIVDAVVKTDKGIIPIDAKFPMENFKKMMASEIEKDKEQARKDFARDVKKHINDIAKKYILPTEGTVDFALMYIPSEAVAYEVTVNMSELAEFAHQKRVIIVSPNQFNYFLKVILIGLEGKKIEEKARFILNSLKAIKNDSEKFGDDLSLLVKHITHAKSTADAASMNFMRLSGKIDAVQQVESPSEAETLPLEV